MNESGLQMIRKIRETEAAAQEGAQEDPWRLTFHLMPPTGWLNDPNGLCQMNGVYHVFFQYSPFDPCGGEKFWGHYTSRNLTDWEYAGVPLAPDEQFDRSGVYSGSCLVREGTMYLFYTGNVKLPGKYDYVNQGREANTVLVESRDGRSFGEKKLLLTNKDYPADYTLHIRDPKVFAVENRYYMVLGGRKKNDRGAVLLYESRDLEKWVFCRELTVPMQFGYMWECPDLFCTGEKWFLSLSPQGLPRGEHAFQNVYTAGYFQINGDFRADCRLEDFREWDKGFDFYAPQTFTDESGRTLLIAWAGLPDAEKEYVNPTTESGWQHALTVPRVIREQNGRLLQYPVPELEALRGERQEVISKAVVYAPPAFDLIVSVDGKEDTGGCGAKGRKLSITIADALSFTWDGEEAVLSFTDSAAGRQAGIGRGRTQRRALISDIREIRVLADTSLIEIYVNHGETVFTTRFYPAGDTRRLLVEGAYAGTGALWPMCPRALAAAKGPNEEK